jgi:hypothetical protein
MIKRNKKGEKGEKMNTKIEKGRKSQKEVEFDCTTRMCKESLVHNNYCNNIGRQCVGKITLGTNACKK